MRIFIFKSQPKPALRAFAGDQGGQDLPKQFAPWHAVGVVRADKEPPFKLDRGQIEEAIAKSGFQLFRVTEKKAAVG